MKGEKRQSFLLIIIACIVVVLLRAPSLISPLWHDDEAIYFTIGNAIQHHAQLYVDIADNKPPLIYWLAAFLKTHQNAMILLLLQNLLLIPLVYSITKTLKLSSKKAAIAAFICTSFFALPVFEQHVLNGEILTQLPILLALLVALKSSKPMDYFISGIALGLATLVKSTAWFDVLGLFLICVYCAKKNNLSLLHSGTSFLLGVALLHVFISILFISTGSFSGYITSVYGQNLPYVTSWSSGTRASFSPNSRLVVLITSFTLIYILSFYKVVKNKTHSVSMLHSLFLLWLASTLVGAGLSGRPYIHYLLPTISVLLLYLASTQKYKSLIFLGIVLSGVFLLAKPYYYISPAKVYASFISHLIGHSDTNTFINSYDYRQSENQEIIKKINGKSMYVWGNNPALYALTGNYPKTFHVAAYHVQDFTEYSQAITALSASTPDLLLWQKDAPSFPELSGMLAKYYYLSDESDSYYIYAKR